MGNTVIVRWIGLATVLLGHWLWLSSALAASDSISISEPRLYQLDGQTHNQQDISITIKVSAGPASPTYSKYLGAGSEHPNSLVTDIKIEIKGRQVRVPLSVYADLSTPTEAFLQISPGRHTRLVLVGGDGSEAYKVVITIGNRIVSSRDVYSLIVPNEAVQKTVYSIVTLKDE